MSEWNFENIEGDLRVTHWHDDEKRHPAPVEKTDDGGRRATCEDCHESIPIDRDAEERAAAG